MKLSLWFREINIDGIIYSDLVLYNQELNLMVDNEALRGENLTACIWPNHYFDIADNYNENFVYIGEL